MHVHHTIARRPPAPRRRLVRLLLALAPAFFAGAVFGALVVGVPLWLVGLVSLAVMVAAVACEARAASDGASEASGWDANDGRGVQR